MRRRRDAIEDEATERFIIGGQRALAWKTWISTCDCMSLAVERHLAFAGRDGGIALDQRGGDTAEGLDRKGCEGSRRAGEYL